MKLQELIHALIDIPGADKEIRVDGLDISNITVNGDVVEINVSEQCKIPSTEEMANLLPASILRNINSVLNQFDVKLVHNIMKNVGWEWHDSGTPTPDQIKRCGYELLVHAAYDDMHNNEDEHEIRIHTGGLEAISVDGGKYLELRFVAESNQVDDRN